MVEGRPFKGKELEQLKDFLAEMELEYDEGIEYSACILDDDYQIIATGSVEDNVLKCIAISPSSQGQGLSGLIVSQLIQYQFEQGRSQIFMYTKPQNQDMFEDLGFHTIIKTKDVLFMENRFRGFERFVEQLIKETPEAARKDKLGKDKLEGESVIGSIVANCNPFTLGHRYLIEQALKQCDWLHLFVLSDERTYFKPEERFEMVKAGVSDLERVILHKTSQYIISAATFPTYFMKEKIAAKKANCRLDLELFAERIAPQLGITRRFVGTEPHCKVTDCYNDTMLALFPQRGIQVVEIPRKEVEGMTISASAVRSALATLGNLEISDTLSENQKKGMCSASMDTIRSMVPESTYRYLMKKYACTVKNS